MDISPRPSFARVREPRWVPDIRTSDQTTSSLLRGASDGPVADPVVNDAHDNTRTVAEFLKRVLHRDSLDGKHMPLANVVHELDDTGEPVDNAHWSPSGRDMHYGDGPAETVPYTKSLDVIAHEMAHGITGFTSRLKYDGQSGALNESFSDVIGEGVQQWHANRRSFGSPDAARAATWLLGEDHFRDPSGATALRSMRDPRSTPLDLESGRVPQPDHMRDYYTTDLDSGGVHINSGIPNKAAYETAARLGTEKLVKIWYDAFTTKLGRDATFDDAARATVESARELYGKGDVPRAVRSAWQSVGLLVDADHPSLKEPSTYELDLDS